MGRPDDDVSQGEGFLARWAKRKQAIRGGLDPDAPPPPPPDPWRAGQPAASPVSVGPAAGGADATTDDPARAAETPPLPSLDAIVPGADVTAFLQSHVPEALRTAALRKLWVTDPEIRSFVEMADYQWDFNNPDSIPGWSSRLPDIDVKAMAARIFGTDKQPPTEPDAGETPAAAGLDSPPDAMTARPGHDDIARIGPAGIDPPESVGAMAARDAADTVEHTAEHIAGDPVPAAPMDDGASNGLGRRRHGGALPT
jgi:hypothetical protein